MGEFDEPIIQKFCRYMTQDNDPNRFYIKFFSLRSMEVLVGAQRSQGERGWAKIVKLRGDWCGSNEVFIFLAASPLVRGRFVPFCGSPPDSAPDKTAMLRRLQISILKFSPHVRGNPRQSWILGSTMWIPHIGTGFRISCQ